MRVERRTTTQEQYKITATAKCEAWCEASIAAGTAKDSQTATTLDWIESRKSDVSQQTVARGVAKGEYTIVQKFDVEHKRLKKKYTTFIKFQHAAVRISHPWN